MFRRSLVVALALVLAPSCAGQSRPAAERAQPQPAVQRKSLFDPDLHMRTADVRVGMTGYGLSVFKGTAVERFEVEVLAVLRRSEQIGTDVVLVKASGANLEHTGPIAGMSGSPVYLKCDDGRERLLGAFAFGWPGMKDPMGGVQPIEAMLELDPTPRAVPLARGGPEHWDIRTSGAIAKLMTAEPTSLAELLKVAGIHPTRPTAALPGGLQPLALPMGVAGLSPNAARELSVLLAGGGTAPMLALNTIQADGPSSADRLEPGSAMIIPVLLGDLNLSATGTCTTVIGEHVFGFGHPLMGEGDSGLPMAAGEVAAVIPTTELSFKLGSVGKILGTLGSDATAGIAGKLGERPQMIPVKLTLKRRGQTQEFNFQVARHRMLTIAGLIAALESASDFGGTADPLGATRWDVALRYSGDRVLRLRDVGANDNPYGGQGLVSALAMPLSTIQDNPFATIDLESVEAALEVVPASEARLAMLEQISLPRVRYKPGEVVKAQLVFQLFRGGRVARTVELKLPEDLEPGQYPLMVTDSVGAISSALETRPYDFDVKSIDDLLSVLNKMQEYGSDSVYLRLDRPEQVRVALGREALPDLPNSRATLLAESGRTDVVMYGPAVTARLELPYVLTQGEAQAQITVVKP